MARMKRTQVHASISPEAYEALDRYHWENHVEMNVLLREILEDFAREVSTDENSDPESDED